MLDRYETQLYRYYVLSKQKEASALREDAFQMYEQRKLFVNTTGSHFGILVSFKANLENMLVECFSGALNCLLEELDESNHSFQVVKDNITGWKQWLEESNVTTEYQLNKIKRRCEELQDNFLLDMKPSRSLKNYSTNEQPKEQEPILQEYNKHGYLNSKVMVIGKSNRASWTRRWFYLQDGWFGSCTLNTKEKANIQLSERVLVKDAQVRICPDLDNNRRYCFELSSQPYTFYLQAETYEELQQWISVIEYNINNEPISLQSYNTPELMLSPKNTMTSFINDNTLIVAMSTSPLLTAIDSKKKPTSPFILTTASCLISTMLQSAKNYTAPIAIDNNDTPTTSWGMPWLATGINAFSTAADEDQQGSTIQETQEVIVWPSKIQSDIPLTHYSDKLKQNQKELHTIFINVPSDEIVIESFLASLYRQPSLDNEEDTSASYGYSGMTMVTQNYIWFYSCNFMTCNNMLVIPIEKISAVRLEHTYHSNGSLLMIEVQNKTFCFGLWLESADIISEKLNYMIANKTKPIQEVYDHVRTITNTTLSKQHKGTPTSRLTTSISLFASVTPLTVQAQQITMNPSNEEEEAEEEEKEEEEQHRGSPAQGALAAVAARNQKKLEQIQSRANVTKPNHHTSVSPKENDQVWPSNVPQPQGPVNCSCTDHLEKIEIDMKLPVSAHQLFQMLFDTPDIWNQLNQSKNCTVPTFSAWENNKRTMDYVMPVSNPMVKVKEANVNETQEIQEKNDHVSYVVTVTTRTPTLPYADAFLPTIKYCISYETMTSCRLKCSMGVQWLKSIFVKGMVNRAAMKGMQETISGLIPIIENEVAAKESNAPATPSLPRQQEEHRVVATKKEKGSWVYLCTFVLGLVCALFTLYQIRLYQKALNQYGTISWRGVYLKDLENEIMIDQSNETLGEGVVYELFKEVRQDVTQYNYQWSSKQHRHMAMELSYSRERLGAIRYELLSIFRILNRVEYQLLENEYWNWILDKQLNCQKENLCKALENEIN